MTEGSDKPIDETLSRHELDLGRLRDAFALLGVNPCSRCRKFFRRTDPGTLFDPGEVVCYGCIPEWWAERHPQLSTKDRENLESKLVFWLRETHHAETFKDPATLPESSLQEVCIVAACLECRGTGKSLGEERCRFCAGRGCVWVVVSRKQT